MNSEEILYRGTCSSEYSEERCPSVYSERVFINGSIDGYKSKNASIDEYPDEDLPRDFRGKKKFRGIISEDLFRRSFYQVDDSGGNLVTHAWRLWNNESPLDTIDPAIGESYEKDEVIRCIHIGLLCVQESPADGRSTRNVYNLSNAYQ
ncbi:hypothetical protein DY000_02015328 [Brassica cretica]|uniref:S-locus receptor kinase C-terminal domain-containing protein n=1 Tax=Brassica cretica TaxID=69181 RepID=A0ABQ7CZZ5_BRACR|nr:hypothetical protein DY000_02015328 [Brassica cretica]